MDTSQPRPEEEKLIEAPQEETLLPAPEEEKLLPAHASRNSKGLIVKFLLGIIGFCILFAVIFTVYTIIAGNNTGENTPVVPEESVQVSPVEPTDIQTSPEESVQQPCTMEARICPDGSSVGRTGPNCEFAACPGE